MKRVIAAPGRYLQYAGAWEDLSDYCVKRRFRSVLLVCDAYAAEHFSAQIGEQLTQAGLAVGNHVLSGALTEAAVTECCMVCSNHHLEAIVGIGGGRAMDLAKAVSHHLERPLVLLPTSAASDAPCSGQAVIDGNYLPLTKGADLVLVDAQVIASAPVRLFVSGIGDALSTCVEASACYQAKAKAPCGGVSNEAATAMAYLCQNTLLQFGVQAVSDCAAGEVTPAFEKVLQAILYLSAFGFENGGLALAHAVAYGLDEIGCALSHGEKAAFGAIVQLQLSGKRTRDLCGILELCEEIGLPYSFSELGFGEDTAGKAEALVEYLFAHPSWAFGTLPERSALVAARLE